MLKNQHPSPYNCQSAALHQFLVHFLHPIGLVEISQQLQHKAVGQT